MAPTVWYCLWRIGEPAVGQSQTFKKNPALSTAQVIVIHMEDSVSIHQIIIKLCSVSDVGFIVMEQLP